MAPPLLALLPAVTALLLAGMGAEGLHPRVPTVPARAKGCSPDTPECQVPSASGDGLQLLFEDLQMLERMGAAGQDPGKLRCAICKKVLKKLKSLVPNTHNTTWVMQAARTVCSLLPREISERCHNLVSHYLEPIEAGLMQDEEPASICTNLRWCQP